MDSSTEEKLLDFSESERIPRQLEYRFLHALAQKVKVELAPGEYKDYLAHFYKSGYHEIVSRRAEQMAEELLVVYQKNTGDSADPVIYKLIDQEFDGLLDQFIILHCQHLHGFDLPQATLRYINKQPESVDFEKMILDFLQFEKESEKVYRNFPEIPAEAMENAIKNFLLPGKDERIYFICDQSLLGSCKEGFAMTNEGIYWKAHLHPSAQVLYSELDELIRDNGDWITINGHFFNVNPALNIKVFRLLLKFKKWFGNKTT